MKKKLLSFILICFSFICLFSCSRSNNERRLVTIGIDCNYQPFNWTVGSESDATLPISNDQGKFADGYDITIAKKIGDNLNASIKIMKLEWDSLITNLNNNNIDLIIAGMTNTEERRKSIDFTDEYYRSELVLVTKKEVASKYSDQVLTAEKIKNEKIFENQIIESQISTLTDEIIDIFKNEFNCLHATPQETFAKASADVKAGSAFAMTAELPVATSIVNNNKDLGIIHIDQNILAEYSGELGVSIGVRKNDPLKDEINSFLSSYTKEEREKDMLEAVNRSSQDVDSSKSDLERIFGKKEYVTWLFQGLAGTVIISIIGTFLGLLLGIVLALGKNLSTRKQDSFISKAFKYPVKGLCNLYSVVIRGTPMMVQALIFQYACQACGLNWNLVLNTVPVFNGWFIAGSIIITFNTAAYMAEIIQSGLNGVGKDQKEGALSLGFSQTKSLLLVELPQAIKNSIPTIGSEWIVNIKDSSVLNVISVTELFFMAKTIAGATYIYLTTYLIIALMYLVLTVLTTLILKYIAYKVDGKKIKFSLKNSLFHYSNKRILTKNI